MFNILSDLNPTGKCVFVRGDLNVPMQDGKISDTTRLERLAPTIQYLTEKGAKVIVLSHFGRPKGQKNAEFTLEPVAKGLADVLGTPVQFVPEVIGDVVKTAVEGLQNGDVCVLENVRFYAEEEKNDLEFAKTLAQYADIYVNDAFSVSHRAHVSTHALATVLPAYAGLNMQAELEALSSALENPERPLMAIVGGSKVSSKLSVLENLVEKVDSIVIGGGMANTFLYAQGIDIGASLCEKDLKDKAQEILINAEKNNCEILLPTDVMVAGGINDGANAVEKSVTDITENDMALDIGKDSIAHIISVLQNTKTLVWNGPVGAFEFVPFDNGTMTITKAIIDRTQNGGMVSVAGGGDTVSALSVAGAKDKVTYVSTAGGAFLEWLEGKDLPGVSVLRTDKLQKELG